MTSTPKGKRLLCQSTPFPDRLPSLDINDVSPINIHKFSDLKGRDERKSVSGEGPSVSLLKQIQSLPGAQTGKNSSKKSISVNQEPSSLLDLDIEESSDDEYQPPKKARKNGHGLNAKKSEEPEVKKKMIRRGSPIQPVLPKRSKLVRAVRNPGKNKHLKTKINSILSDITELNETEEKSLGVIVEKPSAKGKRNINVIAKRSRAAIKRSKEKEEEKKEDVCPKMSEGSKVNGMMNGVDKSSDSVKGDNSCCNETVNKKNDVNCLEVVGNVDGEKLKERLEEVREENENVNNNDDVDGKKNSVVRRNKPRAVRNKVDHVAVVGDTDETKKKPNIHEVVTDKPLIENTNRITNEILSDKQRTEINENDKSDLKSAYDVQNNEVTCPSGSKESDDSSAQVIECTVINENIKRNIKSVCQREIVKITSNEKKDTIVSNENIEVECARDVAQPDNKNDKSDLKETPASKFKKPNRKPVKSTVRCQSEVNDETTSSLSNRKDKAKKSPASLLQLSGELVVTSNSERLQNSSKDGQCSEDVESTHKRIPNNPVRVQEMENSRSTRAKKLSEGGLSSTASTINDVQQDNGPVNVINGNDIKWECNCNCHHQKQNEKHLFGKFNDKPFSSKRIYGNGVEICKLLKHEKNVMAGYLKINHKSFMSGRTVNNTVYFVTEGKVQVRMPGNVNSCCEVGDVFMIPQDTEYEIRNVTDETVRLSFVKYSKKTS